MKINDLKNQRVTGKGKTKKSKADKTNAFFDLLAGQLEPLEETTKASQTAALTETHDTPTGTRLNGVRLSESSINLLEDFSRALGNLDFKSEDLAPLVEALEGDTMVLLDIKEQLPPDDPLARLIDRVATISYIEAEKFRRGDYK